MSQASQQLAQREREAESARQLRRAAAVGLVRADCLEGTSETAAFEVVVNGAVCGRVARTATGCEVCFTPGIGGAGIRFPDPGDDPRAMVAALRPIIPAARLMPPNPGGAPRTKIKPLPPGALKGR
jgi:hypothetical protein